MGLRVPGLDLLLSGWAQTQTRMPTRRAVFGAFESTETHTGTGFEGHRLMCTRS